MRVWHCISEGIVVYALSVMLLVGCVSRRVVMVSSWDNKMTRDMHARIRLADWGRVPEFAGG